MTINIKATKTKLTPAIKEVIGEKVKVLEKFLAPEDKIWVEVAIEPRKTGEVQRAEISIQPHGFYAVGYASDFYAALDMVVPKIKEQLKKHKEKKLTARKKS